MRAVRLAALATVVTAGACIDPMASVFLHEYPTQINPITSGTTASVDLSCPGLKALAVEPLSLWLSTDSGAVDTIRVLFSGSVTGQLSSCTWNAVGLTSTAHAPVLPSGVTPLDSTLLIPIRNAQSGRTRIFVTLNGQRVGSTDVLSASHLFGRMALGHRGAGWLWPENTLLSLRMAGLSGLRYSEVNVRLTRDTVPVLMHDSMVNRTTNGQGAIWALPAQYVLTLNAAYGFSRPLGVEHVPTLLRALQAADSAGIGLILGVPWQGIISESAEAAAIVRAVREAGSRHPVWLATPDTALLATMHHQAPDIPMMFNPDDYQPWHYDFCQRLQLKGVLYYPQVLARPDVISRVSQFPSLGIRLFVSTTDDPHFADALAGVAPVSGFLTDIPPPVFNHPTPIP